LKNHQPHTYQQMQ